MGDPSTYLIEYLPHLTNQTNLFWITPGIGTGIDIGFVILLFSFGGRPCLHPNADHPAADADANANVWSHLK